MRPRALVVSLDSGIKWGAPKGAAHHLSQVVRGFREAGFDVCLIMPAGVMVLDSDSNTDRSSFASSSFIPFDFPFMTQEGLVNHLRLLSLIGHEHRRSPFTVIYERYSLWSYLGVLSSGSLEVPLVLEVNSPLRDEQAAYRSLALPELAAMVERRNLAGATRIVVVSDVLKGLFEERGASKERIKVIRNISELGSGETIRRRKNKTPHLCFLGSLKKWHGVDFFLDVVKGLHEMSCPVRLSIMGEGPEEQALKTRVLELGLQANVHFHGHLPANKLKQKLQTVDLTVAPYPELDPFYFSPLKIADSLSMGIPVVASAQGDIPEMLGEGSAGLLLPPGAKDRWVSETHSLLKSADRLQTLSRGASSISRDWSWRTIVEQSVDGLIESKI